MIVWCSVIWVGVYTVLVASLLLTVAVGIVSIVYKFSLAVGFYHIMMTNVMSW